MSERRIVWVVLKTLPDMASLANSPLEHTTGLRSFVEPFNEQILLVRQ